jgi:hypothetical protein
MLNNFYQIKNDGRKRYLINRTVSKFIELMTEKNGYLTVTDL